MHVFCPYFIVHVTAIVGPRHSHHQTRQGRFDALISPICAQALTRWGGALLELAHFRQGVEAYGMIQEVYVCSCPSLS